MNIKQIFKMLPEKSFDFLAKKYEVDHKVKKLHGKTIFKLLLYSLFSENNYSLRKLEANFNNYNFQKSILKTEKSNSINFTSIHYRLEKIDPNFFKNLFKKTLKELKPLIKTEKSKFNIIRFDSTIVSLSSRLLDIGFKSIGKDVKSNSIKFTIGFGELPEILNLYTEKKYKGENPALGETILSKDIPSKDIILFDRGLTNRKIFDEITKNNNIFISRMNKNYKIKKISEILIPEEEKGDNDLLLTKEVIGHLYTRDNKPSKFLYRIIHCKSKKKKTIDEKTKNVAIRRSLRLKHSDKTVNEILDDIKNEELIFVTNLLSEETTAKEIAEIYKQRWEIEVFFKFIKQELHFSHLLNRSKNGILSLLYVIMTFSLLILAYRKLNNLKGYKYVKYKMLLELQDEIYELIIKESGGSLEKWKNTKCEFW